MNSILQVFQESRLMYVIGYLAFLFASHLSTRSYFSASAKKRNGFGVVFNSMTGQPESLVSIRLLNLHKQVVRTAITDKQGRYRLVAPRGEYFLELVKPDFIFPSKYLVQAQKSSVYDNLLPSKHIIIKEFGVITKNIPIDPMTLIGKSKIFKKRIFISRKIQYGIFLISPLVALLLALSFQKIIVWIIFGIFMVITIVRFFSFRPSAPPFGTIRDAATFLPLSKAVVRILDGKYNKVLETQITGIKGRYAFVVHPGTYRVLVKCDGYKGVILNFPKINQDGFLIAKDVRLKRV